jgi:hypothetical protein
MKIKILLLCLVVPLFISLIRVGFFPMQDDLQAFRVEQMVKCLKDFQIPCRWIPDMGYQYGYPQFNFYPPSVFYLGAVFNLIGIQVIDSVKILFILGFVLSAVTMYLFLKEFLNDRYSALVGAILYSVVPYKATEVYVRGSLSEFFSFVFFPIIFLAILKLIKTGMKKYIALLGISVGLLLTTHNLMSFIFLPIAGVWMLLLVVVEKKWKALSKIILGMILGFGIAASFSLPVIFENQYVHIETLTGGYFDYRQHFVDIKQLFFSNNFGYGSSYLGPNDDLSLSVGIVQWILALVAVIVSATTFKKDKKLSFITFVLSLTCLAIIFMMHQKSSFIWAVLPGFKLLQFPWRFLSDSTFLLAILGAIGIYKILQLNKKLGFAVGVFAICALFALHLTFFQPKQWLNINDAQKFSGNSWEKQLTISIFDYLPIFAKLPPNKKAPQFPEVLDGKVEFLTYKKGSDFQMGQIKVASGGATLRLPLFDFPGMKVYSDNKIIPHIHSDCRNQEYCLGLITFGIGEGTHNILARLENTPIRTAGNIISLVSIIITALFFIKLHDKKS